MNKSNYESVDPAGLVNDLHTEAPDTPVTLRVSGTPGSSDLRTVKCYRCYSYKVEAICHHCGRFVCDRCCIKTSGWFFADNVFAHLRPSVHNRLRQGAHCRDCFHEDVQISPILTLVISVLALIFISTIWSRFDWLQRGLLAGGAIIVIGLLRWFTDRLFPVRVKYPHRLLPLFAKPKIQVQEHIEANFNVDGKEYLSPDPLVRGNILVTLSVSPDDLERYESTPSPNHPLKFHAGFIALERLKNVGFVRQAGLRHNTNLLLLAKDVERDVFGSHCLQSKVFYLVELYRIQAEALQVGPPQDKGFPLLIKPRRTHGGYRLEITFEVAAELKLEFAKSGAGKKTEAEKGLKGKPVLNSLVLDIPAECIVERTDGHLHFYQEKRVIRWHKNALDVTPPFSVFVEFQQVIKNGLEFTGEYSVTIEDWTVSQLHVAQDTGAQGKYMVRPANGLRISTSDANNGLQWLAPTVEHSTKIEGKLYINTSHLLSQQVQTVSSLVEEEEPQVEAAGKEELHVAPTHHVINAIVEELTTREVFIKQVTETLGYVKEIDIGSNRARYWEIRGRSYLKGTVQPVTLHLVILGESSQSSRPNCKGTLTFELSLRSYIEMGDQETPDKLKEEYENFKNAIKIAAYRGRQIDYQGRRILAWQQEEHFEREAQHTSCVDQVAVILTDRCKPKEGYIFCVLDGRVDIDHDLQDRLIVQKRQQLPVIQVPGCEWVDKWQLLGQIERRH